MKFSENAAQSSSFQNEQKDDEDEELVAVIDENDEEANFVDIASSITSAPERKR